MTNVNYTQFSEEPKEDIIEVENVSDFKEEEVIETETETEEEIEEVIEEPAPEPKEVKGVVANCSRLNVRKEASADAPVLKIINCDTKVKIDEENSTEEFYKVYTGGIAGFCMKEFIEIQ